MATLDEMREDLNTVKHIPQHTRTVVRRECREVASDAAAVKRIIASYARKYGVHERVFRFIVQPPQSP